MADKPADAPADTSKQRQKSSRDGRLSAALRDNLKRRKAQARGRDSDGQLGPVSSRSVGGSGAAGSAEPHDSAGITKDKR